MHQALPPGVPHTVNCIACYAGFLGVGGRGGERRLGREEETGEGRGDWGRGDWGGETGDGRGDWGRGEETGGESIPNECCVPRMTDIAMATIF